MMVDQTTEYPTIECGNLPTLKAFRQARRLMEDVSGSEDTPKVYASPSKAKAWLELPGFVPSFLYGARVPTFREIGIIEGVQVFANSGDRLCQDYPNSHEVFDAMILGEHIVRIKYAHPEN